MLSCCSACRLQNKATYHTCPRGTTEHEVLDKSFDVSEDLIIHFRKKYKTVTSLKKKKDQGETVLLLINNILKESSFICTDLVEVALY